MRYGCCAIDGQGPDGGFSKTLDEGCRAVGINGRVECGTQSGVGGTRLAIELAGDGARRRVGVDIIGPRRGARVENKMAHQPADIFQRPAPVVGAGWLHQNGLRARQ